MRRYERASTLLTSNRPVDDWGKLLGDTAAVTASSIGSYITRMCSSVGREAGAPRSTALAYGGSSRSKTVFGLGATAEWGIDAMPTSTTSSNSTDFDSFNESHWRLFG